MLCKCLIYDCVCMKRTPKEVGFEEAFEIKESVRIFLILLSPHRASIPKRYHRYHRSNNLPVLLTDFQKSRD